MISHRMYGCPEFSDYNVALTRQKQGSLIYRGFWAKIVYLGQKI